jgi:hypothetical protein
MCPEAECGGCAVAERSGGDVPGGCVAESRSAMSERSEGGAVGLVAELPQGSSPQRSGATAVPLRPPQGSSPQRSGALSAAGPLTVVSRNGDREGGGETTERSEGGTLPTLCLRSGLSPRLSVALPSRPTERPTRSCPALCSPLTVVSSGGSEQRSRAAETTKEAEPLCAVLGSAAGVAHGSLPPLVTSRGAGARRAPAVMSPLAERARVARLRSSYHGNSLIPSALNHSGTL